MSPINGLAFDYYFVAINITRLTALFFVSRSFPTARSFLLVAPAKPIDPRSGEF